MRKIIGALILILIVPCLTGLIDLFDNSDFMTGFLQGLGVEGLMLLGIVMFIIGFNIYFNIKRKS